MTREARSARGRCLLMALMLLAATAIVPLTRAADASAVSGPVSGPVRIAQPMEGEPDPGGDADRWWGVAGAALCGLEIRLAIRVPAVGLNPYAIAAGIAGCALAALDVFTTN